MDDLELLKKTLRDLHKSSNLHKGLKILDRVLKPGTDIRDEVTLQLSRCSDNEQQHEIGVRDEGTYINEKNKIRTAFLRLIDNLEKDHLVDNFGKNPIENLNPSKEPTPVPSIQSNWGWLFSLFLIGVFVLSSVIGFIGFKPDKSNVSEPTGNCDTLKSENEILKKTIDKNEKAISAKKDSIESLKRRKVEPSKSSTYDWENDDRTKKLKKKHESEMDSIEREKREISRKLEECKDKKVIEFVLVVCKDLSDKEKKELKDIGVNVKVDVGCINDDKYIFYSRVDQKKATEIGNLLSKSYPHPIRLESHSGESKRTIYFYNLQ